MTQDADGLSASFEDLEEEEFLKAELDSELETDTDEEDELDEEEEFDDEFEEDEFLETELDSDEQTPRSTDEMDSEEKVRLMAEVADGVRASDITILDLRGITIIADFFLICTGKSSIQLRAITDRIEEKMRDEGLRKLRVEGYQEATWILLDYGDVVVHAMAAEQREFYKLEEFWSAAPRLEIEFAAESGTREGFNLFDR